MRPPAQKKLSFRAVADGFFASTKAPNNALRRVQPVDCIRLPRRSSHNFLIHKIFVIDDLQKIFNPAPLHRCQRGDKGNFSILCFQPRKSNRTRLKIARTVLAYWQFVVKIARPLALPFVTVDLRGTLADPAICSQEIDSTRIDDLFFIDACNCRIQIEIPEAPPRSQAQSNPEKERPA